MKTFETLFLIENLIFQNCSMHISHVQFHGFHSGKRREKNATIKSHSNSGGKKWTCTWLTIARKWRISIAPFLSTLIGWIFMPAIWALAGFVPWAEVGMRHTYIRKQYSVSEWQSSKHSDTVQYSKPDMNEFKFIESILFELGQNTYSSLVLPVGMEIGHDGS